MLKNYFFEKRERTTAIFSIYLLTILFSQNSKAQILLTNTQSRRQTLTQIKRILSKKLMVPSKIIKEGYRKNCRITPGDEKYDLVICIKKNGELSFPIYNRAILKNSYQSFLN